MAILLLYGTLALALLSTAAFWPNYLALPASRVDVYTHCHAAVGAAWLLVLASQALLIRKGLSRGHRLLGRMSAIVAGAFVVTSLLLAHYRFSRMSGSTFAAEAYTLYLPISSVVLFVAAYGCGIAWRRSMAVHARFMACTALLLVDPVVARCLAFYLPELPAPWLYELLTYGVEALVLWLMVQSVPAECVGRTAFRRFALAYATVLALWFYMPHTAAWFDFATWYRGLALT